VADGDTGWVFRAGDPAHLKLKLNEALEALSRDAAGWRARVAARIAGYTYAQSTEGLLRAVAATRPLGSNP
jgi:hypothetical protein